MGGGTTEIEDVELPKRNRLKTESSMRFSTEDRPPSASSASSFSSKTRVKGVWWPADDSKEEVDIDAHLFNDPRFFLLLSPVRALDSNGESDRALPFGDGGDCSFLSLLLALPLCTSVFCLAEATSFFDSFSSSPVSSR